MTYVFITLFWRIWLAVTALLVLTTISRMVFGLTFKKLPNDLMCVLLWPLMIFSKEGRVKIKRKLKELV